ncbi:uncharacterized protein LOC135218405 isoform X2 [Macrobrachium nipponense]|uniref:uncharacterized protein LOC135218405 isoform X2 n=1 Tax=Macrobrachium nipponense TaxID=159736 RepID=UPI0030C85094
MEEKEDRLDTMSFGSQRSLMPRRTVLMVSLGMLVFLAFFYLHSSDNYTPNIRDPEPAPEIITDDNYQGLWQGNPKLINYIRSLFRPPSTEAYQLSNPKRKHFTFMEQSKFVGDLYGPGKVSLCKMVQSMLVSVGWARRDQCL